jgi:hypothetical protein
LVTAKEPERKLLSAAFNTREGRFAMETRSANLIGWICLLSYVGLCGLVWLLS